MTKAEKVFNLIKSKGVNLKFFKEEENLPADRFVIDRGNGKFEVKIWQWLNSNSYQIINKRNNTDNYFEVFLDTKKVNVTKHRYYGFPDIVEWL